MPDVNFKPQASFQFQDGYVRNAFRKATIKNLQEQKQSVKEGNRVTPERLGTVAQRFNIQRQQGRTTQDRFIDLFG